MEFFRITKDIPFMRYSFIFNIISVITFLISIFFLISRGLNYSVEFTGGSVIEISYSPTTPVNLEKIRSQLENLGVPEPSVQFFGSSHDIIIRLSDKYTSLPIFLENGVFSIENFSESILIEAGKEPLIKRTEVVGAQVGKELFNYVLQALFFVSLGIVLYLSARFEWRFALSALIANFHDIIIILGCFAFFQWEFSLSVLAAVLSVLGYSVNESVVVFDRVREILLQRKKIKIREILNHAITTTISRTVITHLCTQMMVTTILLFGGNTLHNFALALTIGICVGIYSSVLVSCPLLIWFGLCPNKFLISIQKSSNNDKNDDPNIGAVV